MRGDVYSALGNKRGKIVSDEYSNDSTIVIQAHLPVAESFGFAEYLRDETSGKAFPEFAFSHWETILSDPFEDGSMANEIVKSVRKRKNLPEEFPVPDNFIDKL